MITGELLTRVTVWIALMGYGSGILVFLVSGGRRKWDSFARIAWTTGCVFLLGHVLFAFHYFHAWSHSSVLTETARQTAEVYGLDWSGGLYINYFLLASWVADTIWWWRGLERYRQRSAWISIAWHAFLFFILFQATVVFETGILRGLGIVFSVVVLLLFSHRRSVMRSETAG